MTENNAGSLPSYNLIKIRINPISHTRILAQMGEWIQSHSYGHTVVVANTHVVMESRENPTLGEAVAAASLVIPDGMPLVVVSRWRGYPLPGRSDGPTLMDIALGQEPYCSWRHYFYGGTPEVLAALCEKYPQVVIAGQYAPPFRHLTPEEDQRVVAGINASGADVLWVGLGCPKQERWMFEHQNRLNVPVMLGVGQAFDILAGVKSRAPRWMQNTGLEWFYRLCKEPRRLWKRYLVYNPWFIFLVLREQIQTLLTRGV